MIVLVVNHNTGWLNRGNSSNKLDRLDQRIQDNSENRKFEMAEDGEKGPIVQFYDANLLISQNEKQNRNGEKQKYTSLNQSYS